MDTSKNGFREREGVNSFTYRGRARGRVKGKVKGRVYGYNTSLLLAVNIFNFTLILCSLHNMIIFNVFQS